jgi:hypothetical protein
MPVAPLLRISATWLALMLIACGADDAPLHQDDSEQSAEQTPRDAGVGKTDGSAAMPATGRDVDAASAGAGPAGSRDASTARGDAAQRPAWDDASLPSLEEPLDDAGSRRDAGGAGRDAASSSLPDAGAPPYTPAFHVSLRVHRADSGLSGAAIASALEEANEIWWKQAAICFEVEVVRSEEPRSDGFDLWFHRSQLGCNTNANGVYCGDHDIHSLDVPNLERADNPEWNVRQKPARTSAHELGHGLNLEHYNGFADSNDSLMSSGRQGFKLHDSEISTARKRAMPKALASSPATPCAAVPVVD